LVTYIVDKVGESDRTLSKSMLNSVCDQFNKIEAEYNDELNDIVKFSGDLIKPKISSYCQAYIKLTSISADLYQANEEWKLAARVLQSIDTEDQYVAATIGVDQRCDWRIRTAELFLQDEDNTAATNHIQKARRLLRDLPLSHASRQSLEIRHKTCYSRILDSERKFLQAAVNYMELSQIDSPLISENDLLLSLENAVTCAILAKAGGARTRVLNMLYRDERSKSLKNYKILEKMNKNMILSQKEQDDFSKTLSEHHQATLSGGLTVLAKAVYEHNMLAASQLYKNIQISQLSKLLGITNTQAEDLARVMIQEGRMNATIDQVDDIIEFDDDNAILTSWDTHIQDCLMAINDICDMIDEKYPNTFPIP